MNAVVLRIGTGALTPWHYIQEHLDYPGLFLPGSVEVPCVDVLGREVVVKTRVYKKLMPNIFFLGEDQGDQLMSIRGRDFPILFHGRQENDYAAQPRRQMVLDRMRQIRRSFLSRGELRIAEVNGCQFDFFPVRPYYQYARTEAGALLDRFRSHYEPSRLGAMISGGEYPP